MAVVVASYQEKEEDEMVISYEEKEAETWKCSSTLLVMMKYMDLVFVS